MPINALITHFDGLGKQQQHHQQHIVNILVEKVENKTIKDPQQPQV